jgi:hypothetical protein
MNSVATNLHTVLHQPNILHLLFVASGTCSTKTASPAAAPRELMQLKRYRGAHCASVAHLHQLSKEVLAAMVNDSAFNARLTDTVTKPLTYIGIRSSCHCKMHNDTGSCGTSSCANTGAATTAAAVLASEAAVLIDLSSTSCHKAISTPNPKAEYTASSSNCGSACKQQQ